MKKYTAHFLIITLITTVLGFTGLDFPGAAFVRFMAMVSGIALMLSCLDSVLISTHMKKIRVKKQKIRRE